MEDYNKIEAYINDELSTEERQAFDTQLATDENLREEVSIFKDMVGGIRTAGLKAELETLRAKHESSSKETGTKIFSLTSIRTIAIAASVAVLIGFFFFNTGGSSDPFSSVYYRDAGLPTAMGEGSSDFLTAMVDYKNESYESAIPALQSICESGKDDRACYYLAQSYLNSKQFLKAKSQFLEVMETDLDRKYLEASEWYLTYTLFHLEDDGYKQRLENIKAKPTHRFFEEASQVTY